MGTPTRALSRHEPGLDAVRGLAAGMVFLYHLRWNAGEPTLLALGIDWQLVLRGFDGGVCLFFVLSGYLLSGPFWDHLNDGSRPDLQRYMIRRLARIIPAYWLAIVVFGLILPGNYSLWGLVALALQFLGLHTYADYTYAGSVPVLWSIGIELQFYALLPLLFAAAGPLARRHLWAVVVGIGLLAMVSDMVWVRAASSLVGVVPGKLIPGVQSAVVTQSVFHFLKWFWVGIAVAYLTRTVRVRPSRAVWNGLFIAGAVGFAGLVATAGEGEWRRVSPCGWPVAPAVCGLLIAATPRAPWAQLAFNTAPLRWLGVISYGVYLWHWPIQKAVFAGTLPRLLGPQLGFLACGLLACLVTCCIAWLCHVSIERPAVRWSKGVSTARGACRSLIEWLRLGTAETPKTAQKRPAIEAAMKAPDSVADEPRLTPVRSASTW